MFQIADENTTYEYPVTVKVPAQGGRVQEQTFRAHFRLIPASEGRQMSDDGVSDREFFKRVLAGWEDIQDSNGEPLPFNDSNLEKLIDIHYFAAAVSQAYQNFTLGLPAKNSARPRAH